MQRDQESIALVTSHDQRPVSVRWLMDREPLLEPVLPVDVPLVDVPAEQLDTVFFGAHHRRGLLDSCFSSPPPLEVPGPSPFEIAVDPVLDTDACVIDGGAQAMGAVGRRPRSVRLR